MADTPTVSLAGIAELLLRASNRIDDAEFFNPAEAVRERVELRAAADYAARLAGVLESLPKPVDPAATVLGAGCGEDFYACARFVARLREFATPAATPTTETEQ